ncbi:MAG: amidohydrolase [Bacillota bacterium]
MLALAGGKVMTMTGNIFARGTVIIEGKKIRLVGEDLPVPEGCRRVSVAGCLITPGLVEAHCHVGMVEEIYREEGDDGNEYTDPVTPHLRAIDAVNPMDLGFSDALAAGVTTVVTSPGSANVIGGEMVALKTFGEVTDEMVVRFPAGLKAALGENPKRNYGKDKKTPATRMASAALLREALVKARDYLDRLAKAGEGKGDPPARDLKMEAVARVLNGEIPLRVHAHRADDIMTAVRIAREFNLRLILEHCTEGHLIASRLAALGIPAVVGPVITNRAKVELQNRSLETAAALFKAGVQVAIMTDHPVVPIQYLALSAGLAVRGGLDENRALEAITSAAAGITGLSDRVGSLTPGLDADIVVWEGHPFDLRSRVRQVYLEGELVFEG